MPSSQVDQAVSRVSLWKDREVRITPLSGGLTNENYLVEVGGQRYVMRLPGQSTELLSIDRANEIYNTKAAATTGIGPTVLEHVAGVDVMVLEFIPGVTMSASTLQSTQMAGRMAESFRRLQLKEGQDRHSKAFSFMEIEDDAEPDSPLNLADMTGETRRR